MDSLIADHVVPLKVYFSVAAALFILLGVTVWIALIDLGPFNIVAAMGVAVVKAVLVVLYFMHVKYGSPLTKLFAVGGVFWLLILFAFTVADFWTR
jgi:cytochrome c oxidase subunit 4